MVANNQAINFNPKKFYDTYAKILEKLGIDKMAFSEFKDGLMHLQGYGLINYTEQSNSSKEPKISLKVDIEEIRSGIDKANVFVNDKSKSA